MPRGCAIALLALSALAGAALALLALAFIIVNETQVDFAALARASRAIRADDPSAAPGELVSLSGTIAVDPPLGDGRFLAPGQYLAVERIVEMYAWEEYRNGEDSNGKPRYDERRVWTRSPERGLRGNPAMPFGGESLAAAGAHIGPLAVDLAGADLPLDERLALDEGLLLPGGAGVVRDGYLYIGRGPSSRPQIGDLRVSYRVVPAGRLATVFGALDGDRLAPYPAADGQRILKVVAGDREAALRDLAAVQQIAGWIVRLLAAAALWLGLLLLIAGSRRLADWPRRLGVPMGSARMAALLGLPAAALGVASLWLSRGSMAALAAALGLELLVVGGLLLGRRLRAGAAAAPTGGGGA